MLKPPLGYELVSGTNGYDTICQQKFCGPGPKIAKLIHDDSGFSIVAFKGLPIAVSRLIELQAWVDELNTL